MKSLECTIFNVDHGFCAFVKSPNEYGLLIDCGGKVDFSPVKWIKQNYNPGKQNIRYYEKRRIAECLITHLHADHFSDVNSFDLFKVEKPRRLYRDKTSLPIIDSKIKDSGYDSRKTDILRRFRLFEKEYTNPIEGKVPWGFEYIAYERLTETVARKVSSTDDKYINNRSYLLSIGFAEKKILFPGDMEVEGWKQIVADEKYNELLANTSFFIASHHGHKSGFTMEILDRTGIPDVYIVSNKRGDDHFDSSYSKPENSTGVIAVGDTVLSRVISTRERNKSIRLTIWENGTSDIEYIDTPDNLNQSQSDKLLRSRSRTGKE